MLPDLRARKERHTDDRPTLMKLERKTAEAVVKSSATRAPVGSLASRRSAARPRADRQRSRSRDGKGIDLRRVRLAELSQGPEARRKALAGRGDRPR